MNNGIWQEHEYMRCKYCDKEVMLYKFFHIMKKENKNILFVMCSICKVWLGYRDLTKEEILFVLMN